MAEQIIVELTNRRRPYTDITITYNQLTVQSLAQHK